MKERLIRWVEETILGLTLCPFAAPVWRKNQVRIHLAQSQNPTEALQEALLETQHLLQQPADELATTLIAFPHALQNFEEFLDVAATLEDLLEEVGAAGILQIATFHPDYCFEGHQPEDLSNYTNRAPCPVLHLLREDQISEAVEHHPNAEAIPDINIQRLETMGRDKVEALWSKFMPDE